MKIIKTLLNKIDQYIWKRGGLLFRLWFTFEEYGEEDGEPVGYVKRRLFKFNYPGGSMTHSTCCKAEVKKYSDMGQSWYMCSKCEQPCDVITPPPVPSEIEEEIREIVEKILDKHTLNYTKTGDKDFNPPEIISFDTVVLNKYEAQEEMIKAITALITHHTSEKVKEEKNKLIKALEKVFDNDMKKTWDKGSEIGAQFAGYARGVLSRAIATAQAAEGEGE